MLKVEEVRTIKVTCDMKPDEWDPDNLAVGADTTRWHKSKLLNQRIEKNAPLMDPVALYSNIAKFAHEQGFGDIRVIIKVIEDIYQVRLVFPEQEEQVA